jgi:GrpB-like predicted nucleotidyltransferase (UPF0157 family)
MSDTRAIRAPQITDDDLQAITVGELAVHGTTIFLARYDPAWPGLFELEATRIRATLGDRVRLLEHVGSTSVPGLSAKPVIDIVLAVPDSSDEATYVPDMVDAGYVVRIREPDWYEHRVFKGPDTNVNLHTFTEGCAEIDRMIGFRDWLRGHADERDLYERTKQDLAAREWRFIQHYADAKSEVVEGIIARANAAAT